MRIGIDARVLEKKMTGVGRYLLSLLKDIPLFDKSNQYVLFSKSKINFSDNFYEKRITGKKNFPEKFYSPLWLNINLPQQLKKEKIQLFFTPNHLLPIKKLKQIKTVIVIHDVFYKINSAFHPYSYNVYLDLVLPNSLKKCDSIVTVSESSKNDIVNLFNISEEKIKVIYEYADDSFQPIKIEEDKRKNLLMKLGLPEGKFILYVGLIENRKNINGLLKISDILRKKKTEIYTLIIGGEGYGYQKILYEMDLRHKYVKYLNYVEEDKLKLIYNLAEVFVFPSYYEGFGLPPLEAMQCGIPVLSSNRASLAEIVGDGGILNDPDNHEAFADEIVKLLQNKDFHSTMKAKALKQAKKFNKEKTIRSLLDVFVNT